MARRKKIKVHCSYDEIIEVGELKPHPKNPNKHPRAQIALLGKIIERQGWRQAITISRRSGYMVRGHARREAAILLGEKAVPVDYQDYASDAEELADLVADNKIAELAEMQRGALKGILDELRDSDELELVGMPDDQIDILLKEAAELITPEIEFSEELLEEHNYVVLYFDNSVDWQQARTLFGLKTVRSRNKKLDQRGVGRVLRGADAINKILGEAGK